MHQWKHTRNAHKESNYFICRILMLVCILMYGDLYIRTKNKFSDQLTHCKSPDEEK